MLPLFAESQQPSDLPARVLPDDASRAEYPLYDGLFAYFPAALCEIARWSRVGGRKWQGDGPLRWVREASTDHKNKILRHLLDYDHVEENGFFEVIPLAWRALALAQETLEKHGWAEGRNARRAIPSGDQSSGVIRQAPGSEGSSGTDDVGWQSRCY